MRLFWSLATRGNMGFVLGLLAFLSVGPANAQPVVTFYNNQTSFLAAISSSTVLDFEGIVSNTGIQDFGASYHTANVTFTAPSQSPIPNHVLVVGKNSQTLGAPFDSAILIPNVDPGSLRATFDAGSNLTAVGGYFLNLFGNFQELGFFTLNGSTGPLDVRSVSMGIATTGKPKTFFGYTVIGDTISSLTVTSGTNTAAFDNFTYGTAVPEPSSCLLSLIALIGTWPTMRKFRARSSGNRISTE